MAPDLWPLLAFPLLVSSSVVPVLATAGGLLGVVLVAVGLAGMTAGRRTAPPRHRRKLRAWRRSALGTSSLLDLTVRAARESLRQLSASSPADDAQAIAGDWQRVGGDMRRALDQVAEEEARRG